MLVKDLMSAAPEFVAADAPIRKAAEQMHAAGARLLVVRDGGQIAGVVTDRDLALRPVECGKTYESVLVRDVMTPEAHAVRSGSSLLKAADAFKAKGLWHLLVIDDSARLVGTLSVTDLALKKPLRGIACEVLGHLAETYAAQPELAGAM